MNKDLNAYDGLFRKVRIYQKGLMEARYSDIVLTQDDRTVVREIAGMMQKRLMLNEGISDMLKNGLQKLKDAP